MFVKKYNCSDPFKVTYDKVSCLFVQLAISKSLLVAALISSVMAALAFPCNWSYT